MEETGKTRGLKEVSADIRSAGLKDEPKEPAQPATVDPDAPPPPPEPRKKTPEELLQDPDLALNPDDQPNQEIVESMKATHVPSAGDQ